MMRTLAMVWPPGWRCALGLAGLFGIALVVRLMQLAQDSIWYDEAATIGIAAMDWHLILGPMAELESSPPGYYAAAKLWTLLWNDSIWWLRMLSVLAGIGAIVPVMLLARFAFGAPASWITGAFIALAASHVRLSQDARCYALLFLVTAWAMLIATRLATRRDADDGFRTIATQPGESSGVVTAVALGTLMGGALWLHATAGLIVVGLNVFVLSLLAFDRAGLRKGLALLVIADLLTLAIAAAPLWAIVTHVGAADGYADRWIEAPGIADAAKLYGRTLVAPFLGPFSFLALAIQVLLAISALMFWWRQRNPVVFALATMLAVSLVLMPLVSLFRPLLLDRTALFMLLPLALLLGVGAAALPRPLAKPPVLAAAAAALLLLQAIGVVGWHDWPNRKERWDLATVDLKERLLPGEVMVLADSAFVSISVTRHLVKLGSAVPPLILVPPNSRLEQLAAEQVVPDFLPEASALCQRLVPRPTGLWLVLRELPPLVAADPAFTSRQAVVRALLDAGGTLTDTLRYVGVELQHWTPPRC